MIECFILLGDIFNKMSLVYLEKFIKSCVMLEKLFEFLEVEIYELYGFGSDYGVIIYFIY